MFSLGILFPVLHLCNWLKKSRVPCFNQSAHACLLLTNQEQSNMQGLDLMRVFPRSSPVACFPAPFTGCLFLHAFHRLPVVPRLAPVACFPALFTGCTFSRTWHWLYVFVSSSDWFKAALFGCIVIGQIKLRQTLDN